MRTDLLRLMTWLSPAFPVGAFGYSHGLETAIREGLVRDAADLEAWIAGLVELGSGWTDAVLLAAAWRGEAVAELAEALSPSLERRRETMAQGEAFLTAVSAWGLETPRGAVPYPVAVGTSCRAGDVPLADALTAWLHGFSANLVSVAVRAIPLGHTDAVRVLAALEPAILATAARAAGSTLDDLGACAIASDIAALRHEALDGRLFLS